MAVVYKGRIGKISVKSGHEVEWRIENFCSYTVEDEYYYSPEFHMSDSEWYLQIYPNGQTSRNGVGWISLFLRRKEDDSPPVGACFTLWVKKVDGTVQLTGSKITAVFEKTDSGFGYPTLMDRSELLESESEILSSKSLTLVCTLWTGKHLEPFGSMDALSQHLNDLFISKRDCDATVKVMDEEFSVHKLILSARSPVLAAMFEADMKEKRTGIVQIEDFDPKVFKEFLIYLYSGKIEDVSCDAFELYKVADKYDAPDLKSYCLMLIMTSLSVENVLDAAILGNLFNEQILMLKIQEFFDKNYKEIISSVKWGNEFLRLNSSLANKLLKDMAKR